MFATKNYAQQTKLPVIKLPVEKECKNKGTYKDGIDRE